ncbi:MAG: IS21 family transposase [Fusobacteriaceae bacterium]|jgi:transposase|nr:IS21 family transposase [Aliarcobacter sp.]MBU9919345.1 IS21 family transposase [Fusobacteriaceae bacterium]
MRKIRMEKIAEAIRLHFKLDLSVRQTSNALNIARSSVGDYCQKFKSLNLDIDNFLKLSVEKQEELLFPKALNISQLDNKKVLPDCNYLHNELKKRKKTGVTLALLHEEYKESNPNRYYSYTQFREHYKRYVNTINPSMKQTHLVGEKMFVDYSGLTVPIINKKTGEIVKAQIFVAVLGASGYTFVDASYSQQQKDFINSHVKAYEFFQGCPRVVVPDNLKSAVISNNKKGIVINESYAALARYYNMVVEPARPYKPKDKAKAEQGVLGIQRWIIASLRYQRFFSVDELNDAISILLDKYNAKIVKKFNKSRLELFNELDLPNLQALPKQRYIYKEYKEATVNVGYHVSLDKCEYSVPFEYLSKKVQLRYSNSSVEIYYKDNLIATHPKLHFAGSNSTKVEHMPKSHQYQSLKTNPGSFLNWANNIGTNTVYWVKKELKSVKHPPNVYNKLNAVLSLSKIHGKKELDLALHYALQNSLSKTSSIKSILDKKLYLQKELSDTHSYVVVNNHENLRGNIYH